MTVEELQRKIVSTSKTLNSRIRRLRKEDLPSSIDYRIEEARKMKNPYFTESGYFSASYKNMTKEQLQHKLKYMRGLLENSETVAQARQSLERKMKEWNVKKEEAKRRIKAGRVFYQVLGNTQYKFDSTVVHDSITSFDKTPSYDDLLADVIWRNAERMQDEPDGREMLLEFMNDYNTIPDGVRAHKTSDGRIVFDDEPEDDEEV